MAGERIVDVLKSAAEVNLRYSAVTLRLARDYVKEIDGVLRNGTAARDAAAEAPATPAQPAAAAPTAAEARPPILLVGEAGAEATGAFMLSNSADTALPVGLAVQGELGPVTAELIPASLVIAPGESAVVRIKVAISEAMEAGRDYAGAVVAPGLSAQAVAFVVRRLPGAAPARPAKAKKPPRPAG